MKLYYLDLPPRYKNWQTFIGGWKYRDLITHLYQRADGAVHEGYQTDPCPNCSDDLMWYRESSWRYEGEDQHIVLGKQCERCGCHWNNVTGEIWHKGMTRGELVALWGRVYKPVDGRLE